MSAATRVFVARLAGTTVFDPLGDSVGRVRDVAILQRPTGNPRVVGLVIEVAGRRRVFMPITRVTSVDAGQVISTGLINLRRFEQRSMESLVIGELLDRTVTFKDGSGEGTVEDVGIARQRNNDWIVDQLFVRRKEPGKSTLGLRRRGTTLTVDASEVTGLNRTVDVQGAAMLLAAYEDMRPADFADALQELSPSRQAEVATALDNDRLADVMENLPEDDQVTILSSLPPARAADVLEVMQPDDAADLLHEMPQDQATRLLGLMESDEADDIRQLLSYDENTAGGLMTTLPVILGPETSIGTALAHIRQQDLPPALASVVFVCRPPLETPTGRLLGVAHFQRLLRHPPHEAIGLVLETDSPSLEADASLARVTRTFAAYDLLALPVVDDDRRLLGAVSVDDVLDHILPEDWRESHDEVLDEDVLDEDTDNANAGGDVMSDAAAAVASGAADDAATGENVTVGGIADDAGEVSRG